jgi:hypothetical protein
MYMEFSSTFGEPGKVCDALGTEEAGVGEIGERGEDSQMPRLSRKDKLRKKQRHEENVASRKSRKASQSAAEFAQFREAFDALSEEEKRIAANASEYMHKVIFGNDQPLSMPMPSWFESVGITEMDEKRVVYLFWNFDVFEIEDAEPVVLPLTTLFLQGWISTVDRASMASPLEMLFDRLIRAMESVAAKVPGFAVCGPYNRTICPSGIDLVHVRFGRKLLEPWERIQQEEEEKEEKALLAELPEDEQSAIDGLAETSLDLREGIYTEPHAMLMRLGVTGSDQKRMFYVLWNNDVFDGGPVDVDEEDVLGPLSRTSFVTTRDHAREVLDGLKQFLPDLSFKYEDDVMEFDYTPTEVKQS